MLFFCVKLVFRKNGSFSSQHIHDSQAMKDITRAVVDSDTDGRLSEIDTMIKDVIDQDREMRRKSRFAVNERT